MNPGDSEAARAGPGPADLNTGSAGESATREPATCHRDGADEPGP